VSARDGAPTPESTISGEDWYGHEFIGVRLREADLSKAQCARSTFGGCDLSGAVLQGADFTDADLRGSALGDIDPQTVTLQGASVTSAQAVEIARGLGLIVDEG